MNNAEWLLKHGIKFSDLTFHVDTGWSYIVKDSKTGAKVGTIYTCTDVNSATNKLAEWLDEKHVEGVLTVDENAYLSAVIEPFRNEIRAIEKDYGWSSKVQHIYFYTKTDGTFYLKSFKTGTKYKGMETHKMYSLEELGL